MSVFLTVAAVYHLSSHPWRLVTDPIAHLYAIIIRHLKNETVGVNL